MTPTQIQHIEERLESVDAKLGALQAGQIGLIARLDVANGQTAANVREIAALRLDITQSQVWRARAEGAMGAVRWQFLVGLPLAGAVGALISALT